MGVQARGSVDGMAGGALWSHVTPSHRLSVLTSSLGSLHSLTFGLSVRARTTSLQASSSDCEHTALRGQTLRLGLCEPRGWAGCWSGRSRAARTCNAAFSLSPVRLHDSISEEGFHYLVFDL